MPTTAANTVDFTVPVDARLREQFLLAAQAESRDANDLVRSFMRSVVEQAREHVGKTREAERTAAVEFAQGSLLLEGYTVSTHAEGQLQEYIKGNRSIPAILNELHQRFDQQKAPGRDR